MDQRIEDREQPSAPGSAASEDGDGTWGRLPALAAAVVVEGGLIVIAVVLAGWLEISVVGRFFQRGNLGLLRLIGDLLDLPVNLQFAVAGVIDMVIGIVATIPMLMAFVVAVRSRWAPLVHLREVVREGVARLFAHSGPIDLVIIATLAGVGEEILFRGVIQQAIADRHGVVLALILTSLAFGLLHPMTLAYVGFASLFGLYLGGLAVWTGNIVAPCVAHSLYDLIALTWLVESTTMRPRSPG